MDDSLRELPPLDDDEAMEFHLPEHLPEHPPEQSGDDAIPRPVTPPQQTVFLETAEDTVSLLLRLYNGGIPLFTKQAFRDAAEQLDRCLGDANAEHKVSLMGLDGTPVHFLFKVGQDVSKQSKLFWPGCNIVTAKPRLDYRGLYQLMSTDSSQPGSLERAYLPIDMVQETEIRDAKTGELVVPWCMLNHEEVRERFARNRTFWSNTTTPFGHLRWLFGAPGIIHSIKNVVAFGCVLEVRDLVKSRLGVEVKCFAQDPAYTPIDKQVLGELGITVLDDPRAWLEVEDGSVVIAVDPAVPALEIIADIARPVAIIMSALLEDDVLVPRVQDMMDNGYSLRTLFAGRPVSGYQAFLDVKVAMKRETTISLDDNAQVEIDSSG